MSYECDWCGKNFNNNPTRYGKCIFCSPKCEYEFSKAYPDNTCYTPPKSDILIRLGYIIYIWMPLYFIVFFYLVFTYHSDKFSIYEPIDWVVAIIFGGVIFIPMVIIYILGPAFFLAIISYHIWGGEDLQLLPFLLGFYYVLSWFSQP